MALGGYRYDLPVFFTPSWSRLAVEWEYDASLPRNFRMNQHVHSSSHVTFGGMARMWAEEPYS